MVVKIEINEKVKRCSDNPFLLPSVVGILPTIINYTGFKTVGANTNSRMGVMVKGIDFTEYGIKKYEEQLIARKRKLLEKLASELNVKLAIIQLFAM